MTRGCFHWIVRALQAAGLIAELARQHANDQSFKSPYTQEALKQGYDVPWWEKLTTASFADGKFELGTLTVRQVAMCLLRSCVCVPALHGVYHVYYGASMVACGCHDCGALTCAYATPRDAKAAC